MSLSLLKTFITDPKILNDSAGMVSFVITFNFFFFFLAG